MYIFSPDLDREGSAGAAGKGSKKQRVRPRLEDADQGPYQLSQPQEIGTTWSSHFVLGHNK